ncbi:MAG: TipAS antibiotic-recognition domain-containing protein [Anaerolineae bacterium]|nr:TipAS antibiotic-recognition domain-containing protein [Anaerolineae bacterium]
MCKYRSSSADTTPPSSISTRRHPSATLAWQLYAGDPEFRAFYDRYREGLTAFLSDAMTHYAINMLGD